jgi:hypothetical protein
MIARFPGKCARTGRAIKPGDVITFTAARKVVLVQQQHADNVTPYTSDTIQFGDRTFYRNRAGRCEDAPCCGCCTI